MIELLLILWLASWPVMIAFALVGRWTKPKTFNTRTAGRSVRCGEPSDAAMQWDENGR